LPLIANSEGASIVISIDIESWQLVISSVWIRVTEPIPLSSHNIDTSSSDLEPSIIPPLVAQVFEIPATDCEVYFLVQFEHTILSPSINGFGKGVISTSILIESLKPIEDFSTTKFILPLPAAPQIIEIELSSSRPSIVPPETDHFFVILGSELVK